MNEARARSLERNLRLYPLFEALAFTPVFLPVVVLFFQDNGLDLEEIYWLQGLFAVAIVVLEVPTGMVADRLGKRTSLLLAEVTLLLAALVYGFSHGFWSFFVAEVIFAVGVALFSGADSALLYDTLRGLDRQDEYRAYEGRAKAWQLISFALSNVVGGFVGDWDLRATWFVSMVGPALAFFVAIRFTEAAETPETDAGTSGFAAYAALLRQALRFVRKHRLVRWYTGLLAVLTATASWLLWLYQPYMELTGLPVWAFGGAFAIYNLAAALASRRAQDFDEALGPRGALVGLGVLQVITPFAMALFITPLSFLIVIGHQVVRGIGRPLVSERILRYTYADKRATVLSLANLGGRLFFALSAPLLGLAARAEDLRVPLNVAGSATALALAWLAWRYLRIPEKYFTVKDQVAAKT